MKKFVIIAFTLSLFIGSTVALAQDAGSGSSDTTKKKAKKKKKSADTSTPPAK